MTVEQHLEILKRNNPDPQGHSATEPWVKSLVERRRAKGASRTDLRNYGQALRIRSRLV